MKILLTIFLSITILHSSFSQDTVRNANGQITSFSKMVSKKTDTNEIAYFEGKELRYHQYMPLVKTGEYSIRKNLTPGSDGKKILFKLTNEEIIKRNELIAKFTMIKSPFLQPLMSLNTKALINKIDIKSLEGKVIVLVFWNITCYPCIDSFAPINKFLTSLNDNNIVVITITEDNEKDAISKLVDFKIAKHIYNASSIIDEYKLTSYPSMVVTDKNHIIKYAVTGFSSLSPFESEVIKQLKK